MDSSQSSTKFDIYEFGNLLINFLDLDPVYVLLDGVSFPQEKLERWLLAYWCFYHMGTSSWIVDQPNYWKAFRMAAESKDYPRCHERRHFRGANASKSVDYLSQIGVSRLWEGLHGEPIELSKLTAYVTTWVGFGPWIAFKIADMLERLGIREVNFDDGAMFLFKSPREGAELLWSIERGEEVATKETKQQYAVDQILNHHLGTYLTPPRFERSINVQEAETILCKWKSYMGGRYKVGEDVESCRESLHKFPRSKTAQQLLKVGRDSLW